jgi:hypothetical protein
MEKEFLKKKVSLLVLCNVDPKGIIYNKRKNISDRINDYEKSLPFWLNLNFFNNIIIVENSGYKGDLFKKYIDKSENKKKIELIIYNGQKFNRKRGKGFGAYQQVRKVIKSSQNIKKSDYLVLVPGRYIVWNVKKIILKTKTSIMNDIIKNLTFATGHIALYPKKFIIKYWLPFLSKTNDSLGISGEHQAAKAILRAISDGYTWQLPCEIPDTEAISGYSNTNYRRSFFYSLALKYYSILKKFIFEYQR